MRIATWNLERPKLGGFRKNQAALDQMAEVDADIWVLTETSSAIALADYAAESSPRVHGYHAPGENYTTVLSRWPILRNVPTWEPSLAICVEIKCPLGPCLVYGTIIAYANYRGADGKSKRWVEHRKSIEMHRQDWVTLRREFPAHAVIVAGDFNQSRDGSGWYEDAASVGQLSKALEDSQLTCVTQQNFREIFGLSRATIDHVCIGGWLSDKPMQVSAWPGTTVTGTKMSDHNGVVVRVDA